jgi:small-conductance mechanosensitive channel
MSTADVIAAAAAAAAAVLLAWAGTFLLRRVAAMLPLRARGRDAATRWLPAAQLVLALIAATAVTVFFLGPQAAAAVVGVAAAIILAAAWFAVRDVIAGIVLRAEHGFLAGQTLHASSVTGRIRHVGIRTLEIETDGRRTRIPYSRIGHTPVALGGARDAGALRFSLSRPRNGDAAADATAIRAAVLHAFFAPPAREPLVRLAAETGERRTWEVTVHADPAHLPAIEHAVRTALEHAV